MPSKSTRQKVFMALACKNAEFAKARGIPQEVACEFHNADKQVAAAKAKAARERRAAERKE